MDCCLALLLSSLLALFSVGAGASLSLATVKSKVREQALSMVGRIRKHNDQLWLTSPNLVAEELDSSSALAEPPQDLSSFLDVLGGYQLKLQTMPQLWVVQLREDTSTLRSWLEKWMLMLCPGRLQRPIGQETAMDDPLARFDESWSRVELKKMEGVLGHLLRALHRLRTC